VFAIDVQILQRCRSGVKPAVNLSDKRSQKTGTFLLPLIGELKEKLAHNGIRITLRYLLNYSRTDRN